MGLSWLYKLWCNFTSKLHSLSWTFLSCRCKLNYHSAPRVVFIVRSLSPLRIRNIIHFPELYSISFSSADADSLYNLISQIIFQSWVSSADASLALKIWFPNYFRFWVSFANANFHSIIQLSELLRWRVSFAKANFAIRFRFLNCIRCRVSFCQSKLTI